MTTTTAPAHMRVFPPRGKIVEDKDEYIVELDLPELMSDGCLDELHAEFFAGKLELHIPRKRFSVRPDATPC